MLPADRRICSNLFLQQLLYFQVYFDLGWLLFWFIYLINQVGGYSGLSAVMAGMRSGSQGLSRCGAHASARTPAMHVVHAAAPPPS